MDGTVPGFSFNCMGWTPEDQALFIGLNLGPTLQAKGFGDIKIMILDDQRLLLPKWAKSVYHSRDVHFSSKHVINLNMQYPIGFGTSGSEAIRFGYCCSLVSYNTRIKLVYLV